MSMKSPRTWSASLRASSASWMARLYLRASTGCSDSSFATSRVSTRISSRSAPSSDISSTEVSLSRRSALVFRSATASCSSSTRFCSAFVRATQSSNALMWSRYSTACCAAMLPRFFSALVSVVSVLRSWVHHQHRVSTRNQPASHPPNRKPHSQPCHVPRRPSWPAPPGTR